MPLYTSLLAFPARLMLKRSIMVPIKQSSLEPEKVKMTETMQQGMLPVRYFTEQCLSLAS